MSLSEVSILNFPACMLSPMLLEISSKVSVLECNKTQYYTGRPPPEICLMTLFSSNRLYFSYFVTKFGFKLKNFLSYLCQFFHNFLIFSDLLRNLYKLLSIFCIILKILKGCVSFNSFFFCIRPRSQVCGKQNILQSYLFSRR